MKAYTLKIRGGVEVDSYGKKAGKGALIQEELSATLGVSQDQYLFHPVAFEPGIASREGGHIYERVSGTLRANAGDNQMAVAYNLDSLASNSMKSSNPHSGCRETDVAKTIDTSNQNLDIDETGIIQTLTSRMGTGGGNVPMVMFSKVRRAKHKDDFETWDKSKRTNTLNTFDSGDVRATDVVICMATQQGGAEVMENKCPTITASAGMSGNNQPVICLQGNGIDRADTAGCNGRGWKEDVCYTLKTIDRPAVCYVTSKALYHTLAEKNICPTLVASDWKDPPILAIDGDYWKHD